MRDEPDVNVPKPYPVPSMVSPMIFDSVNLPNAYSHCFFMQCNCIWYEMNSHINMCGGGGCVCVCMCVCAWDGGWCKPL